MVIKFYRGQGLQWSRGISLEDRHRADVVIENQRVTKNRFGAVEVRLRIDQITSLPTLNLNQLEEFFRDIPRNRT